LIAFGWFCVALGLLYSTKQLGLFIDFWTATRIRIAQVVGLGFLFVPITLAAYVGIPADKSNTVSGMINFMRNMGSSVGTSLVTTMIARRSQYHQTILVGNATPDSPVFLNTVNALTDKFTQFGFSPADAQIQAHAMLYRSAQNQAAALAYIDTFWILAVMAATMFAASFLLRRNEPGKAAAGAAAG
jgi:DHA2 family multidrug resistance protein